MSKKRIISIITICVIGIVLLGVSLNYSSRPTQVTTTNQKNNSNETKFIDNLNNDNINECIHLLDSYNIDVNYKIDEGDTIYNKALNIALEKISDTKNTTDYLPLFDKMKSKADKSMIKLNTDNFTSRQTLFLGSLGVSIPNKSTNTTPKPIDNPTTKLESENFKMNGLELLEYNTTEGGRYVIGKIKNNNVFNCSYAEVKIKITDTNGNVLDTPIDNITSLKSGETWSFKIPVILNVNTQYKYEIIEMKCNP